MKKTATVAVLVVLAVIAATWMLTPRGEAEPSARASEPTPAVTPASSAPVPDIALVAAIPATSDPDDYARAIAGVVFGMDTRRLEPGDYRGTLMGEADPSLSATGRADLARMLTERVPSPEQWDRMRANPAVVDVGEPRRPRARVLGAGPHRRAGRTGVGVPQRQRGPDDPLRRGRRHEDGVPGTHDHDRDALPRRRRRSGPGGYGHP